MSRRSQAGQEQSAARRRQSAGRAPAGGHQPRPAARWGSAARACGSVAGGCCALVLFVPKGKDHTKQTL